MSSEVQTFNHQIFVEGPGALRYSLVARSKKAVQSTEVAEWLSAASLRVQGRLFETVTYSTAKIWSKAVQSLPSHLLKFALNADQNTLPHNANRA